MSRVSRIASPVISPKIKSKGISRLLVGGDGGSPKSVGVGIKGQDDAESPGSDGASPHRAGSLTPTAPATR